jgi:hypothetical protein
MSNTPLYIPELVSRKKWNDYRDEIWGDSYNWSWNRTPQEVQYVVIHHSVTVPTATPDDIALLHKARGWDGIGYHFVIDNKGMVFYVGDVGTARANVLNMNEKVIGVCLIGDFTKSLPTDSQIDSAHWLCQFFIDAPAWPNVKSWAKVVGHKELQATACPGNDWKDTASSMYNRIKDNIPYAPVTQPPTPSVPTTDECSKVKEKWAKTVSYVELPTTPEDTQFEDVQRVIAGVKSRVTDLQNQLTAATAEVLNRTEQVSRLKDQVLNEQKLRTIAQEGYEKIAKELAGIRGVYESQLTAKQNQIDQMGKEKGELNVKISQLQTDLQTCKTDALKSMTAKQLWAAFWKKLGGR